MPLTKEQHDLLTDCIAFLEDERDKLNDFEISFMEGKGPQGQYDSLVEKYEKYGEGIKLTDKQWGVLQRMYDKVVHNVKPTFSRR